MAILRRLKRRHLPAWLVVGLLLGLLALLEIPLASAEHPSFCQGSTVEAVEGAASGRAIQGVSLVIERNLVRSGDTLRARLVNRGDDLASHGADHRIDRYLGSEWTVDPAGPHGPWVKKLWGLGPGRAGSCFEWVVPTDPPSGSYRFVVPVKVNGTRAARFATFEIEH